MVMVEQRRRFTHRVSYAKGHLKMAGTMSALI